MQQDLWKNITAEQRIVLPMKDAEVFYMPQLLQQHEASQLFTTLRDSLGWRQDRIRIFGKETAIPRLQAWYGDRNAVYTYSGLQMVPLPWTEALLKIKKQCENVCQCQFNAVLANLYRDGSDSMGWHSDDEPELGANPVIASVSLGQSRDFDFRHKQTHEKYRVALEHGSLLVMAGDTQQYWQHGISKRKAALGERINLTFRRIYTCGNKA